MNQPIRSPYNIGPAQDQWSKKRAPKGNSFHRKQFPGTQNPIKSFKKTAGKSWTRFPPKSRSSLNKTSSSLALQSLILSFSFFDCRSRSSSREQRWRTRWPLELSRCSSPIRRRILHRRSRRSLSRSLISSPSAAAPLVSRQWSLFLRSSTSFYGFLKFKQLIDPLMFFLFFQSVSIYLILIG